MSMTQAVTDSNIMYLSIIGGNLVQKSEEGVQGAKRREFEWSDGLTWVKWEIAHRNLTGFITNIEFRETQYGEQCSVTMEKDWEKVLLNMGTNSRYFTDFGRKLPNLSLAQEVELNPYDFESKGKQMRWLAVKQDGKKVQDYYFDFEKKESLNWIPSISKDKMKDMTKKKWQVFFIQIEEFLIEEVKKSEFPTVDTWTKKIEADDVEEVFNDWEDDSLPPF